VSDFGSLVSRAALSFTAILYLKAPPAHLGLLMVFNLLPRFVIGPVAGLVVDRLPRRAVMILADLGRAALLVTIPVAALFGRLNIWHLYLVTATTGLLSLVFEIADRSYLPTLVPPEGLVAANSRLTATSSVAEFSAFGLGGWLVQWFTGPIAILVDAVSFLVSAASLGLIRTKEPARERCSQPTGVRSEIREGWSALRGNPVLSTLARATLLLGLTGGVQGALIVAYMARDIGFRPGILGMIWSIGGFSSLAGALLAQRASRLAKIGDSLAISLLISGFGVLFVAMAHGATWLSAGLLIASQLTDGAHTLFDIQQNSIRQATIPEHLLGRVNSLFETIGLGATLAGALAGGLLAERIGLRAVVTLGAAGTFAAAATIWWSPMSRTRAADARLV
jgi:predicted MFS family arabinose efflux permease